MKAFVERLGGHARERALFVTIAALVAFFSAFARSAPPPRSVEGVAAMLGEAVGGEVRPEDFVWESRGGFLGDALLGRRIVFLAKRHGESQRDLFRARVRLTREGRPLRARAVEDLSSTPDGDEHDLSADGSRVAFATSAFGAVQGITVLDLEGDYAARAARTTFERARTSVADYLETGSFAGAGRLEIAFAMPPTVARFELAGDSLVMALGPSEEPAAIALRDGALNSGPHNTYDARAQFVPRLAPSVSDLVVEASRQALGVSAARRARAWTFGLGKLGKHRVEATPRSGPSLETRDAFPPTRVETTGVAIDPWRPLEARDGGASDRLAVALAYVHEGGDATVELVAIDLRQLDLRLAAGFDDPIPTTGPRGSGKLPDESRARSPVAAFAAGPSSILGSSDAGTIADGRTLAPPRDLATIALGARAVRFGSHYRGAVEAVSLLQAPAFDPIDDVRAARSAIGFTNRGHAMYAWSANATPEQITRALAAAGSIWSAPLATEPARTGFVLLHPNEPREEPLSTSMSFGFTTNGASANRFLYLVPRDPTPKLPLANGVFAVDAGTQPAPAFLPAIHAATSPELGAEVHLTTFAPGRFTFRLRAGSKEPATKAALALPLELAPNDAPHLLAQIGLGTGRRKNARGLTVDKTAAFKVHDGAGVLVIEDGRVRVALASDPFGDATDVTELPITADGGKLRAEAREVGSIRARAAACVLDDGTFIVARTRFDSDEATTQALLDLGCPRVVALDRGSHEATFVRRAGVATDPPMARDDVSVLDALEAPMNGAASPF